MRHWPLPQLELGTDELVIVEEEYERKKGEPMHELVGLPANWPEEYKTPPISALGGRVGGSSRLVAKLSPQVLTSTNSQNAKLKCAVEEFLETVRASLNQTLRI